jgi:hypothetical protein
MNRWTDVWTNVREIDRQTGIERERNREREPEREKKKFF